GLRLGRGWGWGSPCETTPVRHRTTPPPQRSPTRGEGAYRVRGAGHALREVPLPLCFLPHDGHQALGDRVEAGRGLVGGGAKIGRRVLSLVTHALAFGLAVRVCLSFQRLLAKGRGQIRCPRPPRRLLFAKDPENSDPVALADKVDVAMFVEPFFQGVPYGILGLLRFGSQN